MGNVVLLRFDETADALRPVDSLGNLDDLATEFGLVAPTVVDAAMGRGRRFVSASNHGYRAKDVVPGSTLLTRDITIQVILNWQLAAQDASGNPGTIYAHGLGPGTVGGVAEHLSAGLELEVVDPSLNLGALRWLWGDVATGAITKPEGGLFQPHATEYVLLTATRRWVSATEVVVRYYYADQLLAEVVSTAGSIGGGTTGTTSIGARYTGGVWSYKLDGTIDELRVVDYEMTLEEIKGTWDRITVHQPRGYQLVRELHDPGFPISEDPVSRVQKETRLWGHSLGYAMAQAENLRNILPSRAYGEVLEAWESIVKESPKPGDSVDKRRARVVSRERQLNGVSIVGIHEALEELIDTDPENLEIYGFTPDTVDTYDALGLNTTRWTYDPAAQWTIVSNALRVLDSGASGIPFTGALRNWYTARSPIGGNGRQARILAKVTVTTLAGGAEVGLWFGDRAAGNFILFGIRNVAGTRTLVTETYRGWISSGLVTRGTTTTAAHWLQLRQLGPTEAFIGQDGDAGYAVEWSTVSESGPWTTATGIGGPGATQWAGLHARTADATGAAIDAAFDTTRVRAPWGDRAFHFYVYRNPALAGSPDLLGASNVLRALKQAHTVGAVLTEKIAVYEDADTPYDSSPMGGI